MIKTLIKISCLTVLPFLYLIFAKNYNPLVYLNEYFTEKFYSGVYKGTFLEIETQLLAVNEENRPKKFQEIAAIFPNELRITSVDALVDNKNKRERLVNGEVVLLPGETESIAFAILNSQWALSVATTESDQQSLFRIASGPLKLFENTISDIDPSELSTSIEELKSRFGWSIEYLNREQLEKLTSQYSMIELDGLEWIEDQVDSPLFIFSLDSGDAITVRAIIKESLEITSMVFLVMLFFLGSAMGLLIWLWPLWDDYKRLNRAVNAFGEGQLNARVKVRTGGFSQDLGETFNSMAASIQNLIKTNQNITNSIAHDLRTPLARLKFASTMLELDHTSEVDSKRYQAAIKSSIEALDYLIDQSLVYSRYNRSTNLAQFKECNFATEIIEEVEQFGFENERLVFETNVDSSLINTQQFIDPKALRRALTNLLSNASKYADSFVLTSFYVSDNDLILKVEDDGVGISSEYFDHVLEPYVQLDNLERSLAKGTGLGLAIVKQIAIWHAGSVRVSHSPLGGASIELQWSKKNPMS